MIPTSEIANMMQDVGNGIADVFEQMIKGGWRDDLGHDVQKNAAMLRLKDILQGMIDFREAFPELLSSRDELDPDRMREDRDELQRLEREQQGRLLP